RRRGLRRLGARQLVLARAAREAAVPGQRNPSRAHPLQHGGRDRPVQRGPRGPLVRYEHMFVLHADADAFFASVEQRDDPRLRGRPVIVGGGVVLAASYEAKAYGIRTAMGGRQARRLCPDAIVVPPRFSAYTEVSRAMFAVFEDTSPVVEGLSIDEAFLDVRGM